MCSGKEATVLPLHILSNDSAGLNCLNTHACMHNGGDQARPRFASPWLGLVYSPERNLANCAAS